MVDEDETFGISRSALDAARKAHADIEATVHRIGTYLPTRADVLELSADQLFVLLDIWFYESPVEIIPGTDQIIEVVQVLKSRPDCDSEGIRRSVALCEQYIAPRLPVNRPG